jgi:VanZ family protein
MHWLKMRRAKVALMIYAGFLVALIVTADAGLGRRFWNLVQQIPLGDKAGHFILFGTLAVLVNWIMQAREFQVLGLRLLRGSVILMAIVFLEELSQLWFRTRTFDVYDLLADALGIFFFGLWAQKRFQRLSVLNLRPSSPSPCVLPPAGTIR